MMLIMMAKLYCWIYAFVPVDSFCLLDMAQLYDMLGDDYQIQVELGYVICLTWKQESDATKFREQEIGCVCLRPFKQGN